MRPVCLVVLAWNRWPLTRRLLESIARHTDLTHVRVLVVDNGSTDETASGLGGFPWVQVLRQPQNLGFVRGNNIAIRQTGPESDVVLLNNDVEILQSGWLERLQQAAYSDPRVGIVGCRLLLGSGRLLHAGTWIRADTCWGQQIGANETDLDQYTETREVEGIVFACAYLRREVIESVGLLSEDYESYFEDTDYCLRAAAKGYRIVCCGSVTMRHDEHGSTGEDDAFRMEVFERSRGVFRRKWRDRLDARYFTNLTWQSIMNEPSGYAISSREIVRALDEQGVRLSYRYAYGQGTPFPSKEAESSGDPLIDLIRARRAPARPRVCVTYAQGDVFRLNPGRLKIGFTMFEVDGFPPQWASQANRMDEVWIPTEFGRQAMLSSGVTRPIHVIPLGVDGNYFHPGARRIPNHSGEFVFITNLEWGERKNTELLLQTFNATFRRHERAILVCKISNRNSAVDVPGLILDLGLDAGGGRIHLAQQRGSPLSAGGPLPVGGLLRIEQSRRGLGAAAHRGHGVRAAGHRDRLEWPHRDPGRDRQLPARYYRDDPGGE